MLKPKTTNKDNNINRMPTDLLKNLSHEKINNKESIESVQMYPFSTKSFLDLSFYCHLTDLSRYTSFEIVIYIESESVALGI